MNSNDYTVCHRHGTEYIFDPDMRWLCPDCEAEYAEYKASRDTPEALLYDRMMLDYEEAAHGRSVDTIHRFVALEAREAAYDARAGARITSQGRERRRAADGHVLRVIACSVLAAMAVIALAVIVLGR